jgi:P-type conjugative transfer protein TrbJ
MPRTFRRLWRALALSATLALAGPSLVNAQIPVTDAAHIALNAYWHYVHYLQFALTIYQQVEQLNALGRQIDNQVVALRKLGDPQWREIASQLSDLQNLMQSGSSLGYPLPGIGDRFRTTFPGWTTWWGAGADQDQTVRALTTMRAGLTAVARQGASLEDGETTLASIRAQMQATAGHQQALEQLTTLATFSAQEQLLTRQALATGNNLQAVSNGYWLDREAQGRATQAALWTASSGAAFTDHATGWTFVPSWWPFQ